MQETMKFKESKFYRPRTFLVANEGDDDKVHLAKMDEISQHSNHPFTNLLGESLADALPYSSELVIKEQHLSKFIKCTDYVSFEYSKTQHKIIQSEQCYFHPEFELFIVISPDLSREYDKQVYEKGIFKVDGIYYDNQDFRHAENIPQFFTQFLEKYMANETKISVLVTDHSGFALKKHKIKPYSLDIQQMYNDDFLPVHEHILDQLTNSRKGIVLLHGLAGTGKTNYIKWLTNQIPDKDFIFVPTTMIHRLTDPSFITILMENKNAILVLEDCENYIAERSADNPHTDVVASILNIADGMLSDIVECQMICTFNAPIDNIDTALLRKGRLIAEYRFKELATQKANAYLEAIGSEARTDKPLTLAEIIHIDDQSYKEKSVEKSKIGFM